MKPNYDYIPEFYLSYVDKVSDKSLIDTLDHSKKQCFNLLSSISEEKGSYAYASGKWTVKELINHIIDAERVFVYRALSFARGDKTELPGFDENAWTPMSDANERALSDLVDEYQWLSGSTLAFFRSLSQEALGRVGLANGSEFTVANIGFIIAGHEMHHLEVLKERYLS